MKIHEIIKSPDDNSKRYVWKLEGQPQGIESGIFSGIGKAHRISLTVSAQNGCSWHVQNLQCRYCLTGQQNYYGNLSSKQILEQILGMVEDNLDELKKAEVEVAYMGMGEPGNNYAAVRQAIIGSQKVLKEKYNLKVFRHIFATSGIPIIIDRLRRDIKSGVYKDAVIKLHLSLHGYNSSQRRLIMPIEKFFPMDDVLRATCNFGKALNAVVNINYMLFKNYQTYEGVVINNVDEIRVNELLDKLDNTIHKIIFCEFNDAVGNNQFVSEQDAQKLCDLARARGFQSNIFGAFGKSIQLACGQLSGKLI